MIVVRLAAAHGQIGLAVAVIIADYGIVTQKPPGYGGEISRVGGGAGFVIKNALRFFRRTGAINGEVGFAVAVVIGHHGRVVGFQTAFVDPHVLRFGRHDVEGGRPRGKNRDVGLTAAVVSGRHETVAAVSKGGRGDFTGPAG